MPLINFRTNLTSLRFGMDQPGGGDSGQPFIQSPIENANTPTEFKDLYSLNRTSLDFPIRGGAISSLVNGTYTTNAAIIDTRRIKKFFASRPQGDTFINKQKNLQLTNPKTQVPNSLQFVGISLDNAVIPVTQVYNPANTLAQVAASGTGAHFNRHGVSPSIYESLQQTYQYIVGAPQNNTEITNRLAILRALKLIGNTNFLISSDTATGLGIDPALVDRLGISTIQNQLFNYPGGPGSNYGIGFTRIFRATNTDAAKAVSTIGFTLNGVNKPYSAIAFTYQQLAEQDSRSTNPLSPVQAVVQDFRTRLPRGTTMQPGVSRSPSNYRSNLITRYNIGSPGSPNARTSYVEYGNKVGEDKLNLLSPFFFDSTTTDPWAVAKEDTNDIIKFAFECLDNNNPAFTTALVFRAFLDGQINDSHTADYNAFRYLGRGETFRTYQGFDRAIGFTFKIFTQSRQEMLPLYQKLNQLISQVYPDYSPNYNLMRGNVVRLTIGDYIYRTPGFLENVNVTIDNSNTSWEILLNEFDDSDVRQLPHIITVQCNFRPIMDLLPRKESANYAGAPAPFVPLIVNKDQYLDPNSVSPAAKAKLIIASDQSPLTTIQGPIIPVAGSGVGAQATGNSLQQTFMPAVVPPDNFAFTTANTLP